MMKKNQLISCIMAAFFTFGIAKAQSTCEVDGDVYYEGDIIRTFQTRCGSIEEYPCYCAPDQDPPISCPYCGFALENGDLLCLMEGESESFANIDGISQTCACRIVGNEPVPDCNNEAAFGQATPEAGLGNSYSQKQDDVCVIDLPDGTTRVFEASETLGEDVLPNNRCGQKFPCFCNPSMPGNIDCPYCRFPTQGGGLVCAEDGELVSFIDLDGVDQECSCQVSSDSTEGTLQNCGKQGGESQSPPFNANPEDNSGGVCTVELESGEILTLAFGESYGDNLQTRCGSSAQFPCFCNPALPNQMDCPYCGFVAGSGDLLCAKDQEVVTFDAGGSAGNQICSCRINEDPSQKPIMNCSTSDDLPPSASLPDDDAVCSIVDAMGDVVTVENGKSFGNLVEGVCGDSDEWPAICNTEMISTISRQFGEGSGIEYPYCIYTDTLDGDPVCARSDDQVTYTNDSGQKMQCSCLYLSEGLGGAQSNCSPDNLTPNNPTQQATPAPATASFPTFPPSPPYVDSGAATAFADTSNISSFVWSLASSSSTIASAMGLLVLIFL